MNGSHSPEASPPSDLDSTVAYYDRNAAEYARSTVAVDMSALYAPFLSLLAPGARILDVGCGSGRDLRAFREAGYEAHGLEPSPAMARIAAEFSGCPVATGRVQDLESEAEFDGVWCCASLLHVPRAAMHAAFERILRSLRFEGVCYVSFKLGPGDREDFGRLFTDMQEDELTRLLRFAGAKTLTLWTTPDQRPGRSDIWLNCLLRKGTSAITAPICLPV